MNKVLKHNFWLIGILFLIEIVVLSIGWLQTTHDVEIFIFVLRLTCLAGLLIINRNAFKDVKNKTKRIFYSLLIIGVFFISWFLITTIISSKLFLHNY